MFQSQCLFFLFSQTLFDNERQWHEHLLRDVGGMVCCVDHSEQLPLQLNSPLAVRAAEMQGGITASALAAAIENAERERAASPDEVPIAEWEVQRVQRRARLAGPANASDPRPAASPPNVPEVLVYTFTCCG